MDETKAKKPWHKNPFLWFALIGLITIPLMRPLLRRIPDPPPVIGQVPPFELTDQRNKPFSFSDLEGDVYVVNFIFTRCGSICPLLSRSMARLQERYEMYGIDEVKLLSISVDPEYDTPERLSEYADLYDADPERWTFLTGGVDAIEQLVVGGFKTAIGEPTEETGVMDIAHSGYFVLVDPQGGIRGYYGVDGEGLDEIYHRSRHVLNESR